MIRQVCFGLQVGVLLFLVAAFAAIAGQITPKDTTIPNQFNFTSVNYFTSRGATNAVIEVRFAPGSRSWSGSVNYCARDGTAISNQDYTAVSGSLSFSGNSYGSFTVPLTSAPSGERKTILLFLSPNPFDPNVIISSSNAVLNINLPPPPNLKIMPDQSGGVMIVWPDDNTDVFVEKRTPPATNWSALPATFANGGLRLCPDVSSESVAFYRLRRAQ